MDPGRLQVLPETAVEVVADGDLPLLASLFPEPQNALGPLVLQIPSPQPGDGADAGPGVGQGSEQSPVAEAHDVGGVDRGEQVPGLLDGKAGILPSVVSCLRPRTDWKGFRGAAWRVTRVSKKCRRAARAWFLVELSPGSSSMKRPARPGETWGSSRP